MININDELKIKYLAEEIVDDKKKIMKNTSCITVGTLVTSVGVIGIVLHGKNYFSELSTNAAYFDVHIQEVALSLSSLIAGTSGILSVHNLRALRENLYNLRKNQKEYDNLTEKEQEKIR